MRVAIVVLTMMAALIGFVVLSYQREVVVPTEADLIKYPDLLPFQAGRSGFRGIKFDMDTNEYSFAFPVSFDGAESFFDVVDAEARRDGWTTTEISNAERVYSRKKAQPMGPLVGERVTLRYDLQGREVTLLRQDVAQ